MDRYATRVAEEVKRRVNRRVMDQGEEATRVEEGETKTWRKTIKLGRSTNPWHRKKVMGINHRTWPLTQKRKDTWRDKVQGVMDPLKVMPPPFVQ